MTVTKSIPSNIDNDTDRQNSTYNYSHDYENKN